MKYKHCIFDLDGTIIDSISGIKHSFNSAYEQLFQKPCLEDITDKIGPPLIVMIKKIIPEISEKELSIFVNNFKADYDVNGYKKSILYDGIKEVFKKLQELNVKLYIATNKRYIPTLLITKFLQIDNFFFDKIGTLDTDNYENKAALIKDMIVKYGMKKTNVVMIGDTDGDFNAANLNKISFIFAEYGYQINGNFPIFIKKPIDILNLI